MTGFYLAASAVLLATVLAGLVRVVRGPAPEDRMIAAQLFGTTGLAVILLLGAASGEAAAADIAIVFALLAALATVVFVRCGQAMRDRAADSREADTDPERGDPP